MSPYVRSPEFIEDSCATRDIETAAVVTERQAAPESVLAALRAVAEQREVSREQMKAAVKVVLEELTRQAPGRSVEVRVPPFAAVQAVAGSTHRRGTPPALVQLNAATLLRLAVGDTSWTEAVDSGAVRASGERSDLSALFPLYL